MNLREQFVAEIEGFLKVSKMEPSTFGRSALNDPRFVATIRAGRAPNLRTIERVRQFIAANRKRRAA